MSLFWTVGIKHIGQESGGGEERKGEGGAKNSKTEEEH